MDSYSGRKPPTSFEGNCSTARRKRSNNRNFTAPPDTPSLRPLRMHAFCARMAGNVTTNGPEPLPTEPVASSSAEFLRVPPVPFLGGPHAPHHPRPARHATDLQKLADRGRLPHAPEQPGPRGGLRPRPPDRLRRPRQGGPQLGVLRRHPALAWSSWNQTRRCWCRAASPSPSSAPTRTRRAC